VSPAKDPPPYGLKVFKGVRSFLLTRQFSTFLLSHPVAAAYLEWSRDTAMPEEHVVHTLSRETQSANIMSYIMCVMCYVCVMGYGLYVCLCHVS